MFIIYVCVTSVLAVFNNVAIQAPGSYLLWSEPLQAACAVCHIAYSQTCWLTSWGWSWQKETLKRLTGLTNVMHKGRSRGELRKMLLKRRTRMAVIRTNRHEGFGVETWLRQANAVDSKHPHLIQNTFNHPLSLICSWFIYIKVKFCPSGRAFLLSLHEITWLSKTKWA